MGDSEIMTVAPRMVRTGGGAGLKGFVWFVVGLSLAFCLPLAGWVRLALASELNSHVILIPLASAYLVWIQRRGLVLSYTSSAALAAIPVALGFLLLGVGPLGQAQGWALTAVDVLAFRIAAFWCLLVGGGLFLLGAPFMRQIAFAAGFLAFMVPVPTFLENAMEIFLQRASAEASELLFWMTATTYFRDGQTFRLPGVVIRVAQECSGVRSSYALFITSIMAGYLFLRSPWRRAVLAFCVIPLGILRNGFRIWTLATLAWRWDPKVLDSALHHRGGPIFFALSLVPFFLLLWWLRKGDSPPPGGFVGQAPPSPGDGGAGPPSGTPGRV